MSTTTIADPSRTNPSQGYTNDLNLTQDMLMDLTNGNIDKHEGIFKVSAKIESTFGRFPKSETTQDIPGGGTDTTSAWKNAIRFRVPFHCTYIGLIATLGPFKTIDGGNYFNVQGQASTYITVSGMVKESEWSNVGGLLTMNSTSGVNLTKSVTGISQALPGIIWNPGATSPATATTFRVAVTHSGNPEATLQVTAVFKTVHV
jgi:hypothetical protein